MEKRIFLAAIILFLAIFAPRAQSIVGESLFTDSVMLAVADEHAFRLSIDNISFFNNCENDGKVQHGYTLPGFRLTPRLVYQPIDRVKLEAGVSALRFWGADRYPNYAYIGIADWKADNYQVGFHLLPFFRAQVQLNRRTTVVLGNIYGGSNHRLIEPLYNYELNLIADPETGIQLVHDSRFLFFDAWLNWETFMFNNQEFNEAMTFGSSLRFNITSPQSAFYMGIPVQSVVHHRGGELDNIKGNVSTEANGATGLSLRFNQQEQMFRFAELNIMGAGYKYLTEQDVARGWAFYANIAAQLGDINLKVNYWHSGNFVNLFGNTAFSNISTSYDDYFFPRVTVVNPGVKYERQFARGIHFGANTECFYNPRLTPYLNKVHPKISAPSFSWSCGLFIRVNPEIFF
jgi:hypothetical protein